MMKSIASRSLMLAGTVALLQFDGALASSDIPEFPKNRYTPWNELNWVVQNDARFLMYTPETWNTFLTSPLERMSYEQVADFLGLTNAEYFSQWETINSALQNIAIDSRTWDCWINHYIGNDWDDLVTKHNVSWAFEELGWTKETWKSSNPADWPETEQKAFSQLTPAEARAAERICCPAAIWDGYPLDEWDFTSQGISTTQLSIESRFLTDSPTRAPITAPTRDPTGSPTTLSPTVAATIAATSTPTMTPTKHPTTPPVTSPTMPPTLDPTANPTQDPTSAPTFTPTASPTTFAPTKEPSSSPTKSPTEEPTKGPTQTPTLSPTKFPTVSPTLSPTREIIRCIANFTVVVRTDKYPRETSWTLTETTSLKVVAENEKYTRPFEAHQETTCIQYDTCYVFTISDAWDDGMCCENGHGSYAGYIEYPTTDRLIPIPGLNGGAFESHVSHMFCLNSNGDLEEGPGLGGEISNAGIQFSRHNGWR